MFDIEQATKDIEEYLAGLTLLRRKSRIDDDSLIFHEELVLKRGVRFKERSFEIRAMPLKQCFNNAYVTMITRYGYHYCEGWAYCGTIAVHHAWCCDDDGVVYDPTWTLPEQVEAAYIGCVFEEEFVIEQVIKNGNRPGIFYNGPDDKMYINEDALYGRVRLKELQE